MPSVTRYVGSGGSDGWDGSSWGTRWATWRYALSQSASWDNLWVGDCTVGSGSGDLVSDGTAAAPKLVRACDGSGQPRTTGVSTITCTGQSYGVNDQAVQRKHWRFERLRWQGASSNGVRLAAWYSQGFVFLYCETASCGGNGFQFSSPWPVCVECLAQGNSGIGFCYYPRLMNCRAIGNSSYGVYLYTPGSDGIIAGCLIHGNSIGIYCEGAPETDGLWPMTVADCTIDGNTSHGIYVLYAACSGLLAARRCIIANNGGYGVLGGEGQTLISLLDCHFHANTSGDKYNLTGLEVGTTSGDPKFLDRPNDDFRLALDSPAWRREGGLAGAYAPQRPRIRRAVYAA